MADVETLRALLGRVRAATGRDREIDCDLARWQGWTEHTDEDDPVFTGKISTWWAEPGYEWSTTSVPPSPTGSFDAAERLVDETLPGAFFLYARGRTRADEPLYACELLFGADEKLGEAEHECGPLAVCAALLSALIAQAEGGEHAE